MKRLQSPRNGISLVEVLVAVVILTISVPLLFQTFTGGIHLQNRRAIHEESILFASDYLEYTKLSILNPQAEQLPFDTIRLFRGDTLRLVRTRDLTSKNGLVEESFSVDFESRPIVEITHTVPEAH